MRRAARVDGNHGEIRDGLRRVTVVEDTHGLGDGFPDLVARHVRTGAPVLLEVKDPAQPPSKRALTPAERALSRRWGNAYRVVLTVDEALKAVGVDVVPG